LLLGVKLTMKTKSSRTYSSPSPATGRDKAEIGSARCCEKRKALGSLPNGVVQGEKKKAKPFQDKRACECVASGAECEVRQFKKFVTEKVAVKNFENNKALRNEAYYRYATEVKKYRGKGNQYKVSECCRNWIRTQYSD